MSAGSVPGGFCGAFAGHGARHEIAECPGGDFLAACRTVARGGQSISGPTKTMAFVEQIAGVAVALVTLLDIFLTVLYARAGTAVFSAFVSRSIWRGFR